MIVVKRRLSNSLRIQRRLDKLSFNGLPNERAVEASLDLVKTTTGTLCNGLAPDDNLQQRAFLK